MKKIAIKAILLTAIGTAQAGWWSGVRNAGAQFARRFTQSATPATVPLSQPSASYQYGAPQMRVGQVSSPYTQARYATFAGSSRLDGYDTSQQESEAVGQQPFTAMPQAGKGFSADVLQNTLQGYQQAFRSGASLQRMLGLDPHASRIEVQQAVKAAQAAYRDDMMEDAEEKRIAAQIRNVLVQAENNLYMPTTAMPFSRIVESDGQEIDPTAWSQGYNGSYDAGAFSSTTGGKRSLSSFARSGVLGSVPAASVAARTPFIFGGKRFMNSGSDSTGLQQTLEKFQKSTPWEILGLQPEASPDEIDKAHRKLTLQFHPDRAQGDKQKMLAEQIGWHINRAHSIALKQDFRVASSVVSRVSASEDLAWAERVYDAIKKKDMTLLDELLKHSGGKEDAISVIAISALSSGDVGSMEILLNLPNGVFDVNRLLGGGLYTPLLMAVAAPVSEDERLKMVQLLVAAGADPNQLSLFHVQETSPLHLAVSKGDRKIVQFLLETGHADPNIRDNDGFTPLMEAWSEDMVERLLKAGAKISLEEWEYSFNQKRLRSPAIQLRGEILIKAALAKQASAQSEEKALSKPVGFWATMTGAFKSGYEKGVSSSGAGSFGSTTGGKRSLSSFAARGAAFGPEKPLTVDGSSRVISVEEDFGEQGLPLGESEHVNWQNKVGYADDETLIRLFLDSSSRDHVLVELLNNADTDRMRLLLSLPGKVFDVNEPIYGEAFRLGEGEYTPLLRAVTANNTESRRLEMVKFLIENGADPNKLSMYRFTRDYSEMLSPLHAAVIKGDEEIVKYLLDKAGADPDVRGSAGYTPLIGAQSEKMKDIFFHRGVQNISPEEWKDYNSRMSKLNIRYPEPYPFTRTIDSSAEEIRSTGSSAGLQLDARLSDPDSLAKQAAAQSEEKAPSKPTGFWATMIGAFKSGYETGSGSGSRLQE